MTDILNCPIFKTYLYVLSSCSYLFIFTMNSCSKMFAGRQRQISLSSVVHNVLEINYFDRLPILFLCLMFHVNDVYKYAGKKIV